MSPITHFVGSWLVASLTATNRRDRVLITMAGVAPDLDGLGIALDLAKSVVSGQEPTFEYYQHYHHLLLHGWPGALLVALFLAVLGRQRLRVAIACLVVFHLHLACDLLGSRGPTPGDLWPICYSEPLFRHPIWFWKPQWRLDGWQNMSISIGLMVLALWTAAKRGYSFLEIFSARLDNVFTGCLQKWSGLGRKEAGPAALLLLLGFCVVLPNANAATPIDPAQIATAARTQIGKTVRYDPAYRTLKYPNGDVPIETGVCCDVVIRALRQALGMDLQKEVHEDMQGHFQQYPKNWGLKAPDKNIDHRRVPNLQTWFKRSGWDLPVTKKPEDYKPGDLVTCTVPPHLPHIMVVSDRTNSSGRPLVIHNIGAGTQEEDRLFDFEITGHYRAPTIEPSQVGTGKQDSRSAKK